MKAWEIVGFAYDGTIYCSDHKPDATEEDGLSPVFASDEGWESDVCDTCHWALDDSREVYGVWRIDLRAAFHLRCDPKGGVVFTTAPIMDGWNGPRECSKCGETLPFPEPETADEDDNAAPLED